MTPLRITIRFPSSLPDLDIDSASPNTTTVLALKQTLRNRIASRSRLRLIYQGRILSDSSSLSTALKPLPPPPPPPPKDANDNGKGKAADLPQPIRVYLNCSIGDDLTTEELEDEKLAAEKPPEDAAQTTPATGYKRPRPRGFDRLLQAGFTQSEISTLRTQFASIHSDRFAPDAMPSPDSMRTMEDAWIDSNAGETPTTVNALDEDRSSMSGVLDVLIKGMM
ncbi:hypothetical protein Golomagni_07546, partial [Golovinomyces magnicellulatus]